jgi:glycosyltransferase involved in cell wall biosynthesis
MIRVAILTNSLNYTDGVSNHIYDLIQGFQRKSEETEFCIITGANNAEDKFAKLRIEIIVWPEFQHSKRSAINFIKSIFKLIRFIQNRQINILHSHNHYHASIATACKTLVSVSTVQTNHGIISEEGMLPHLTADRYIIINRHIVDYFQKNYPVKYRHAKFIRCGIPEIEKPRKENSRLTFIAAGRFVTEKGFDTYIKAVNGLPENMFERAIFYLAGDGDEMSSLLELNSTLGGKVSYLGNVSTLQEKFFETDVLVNPSRSKSEGFPRTIIEAAFAKNLIITSNFLGVTNDLTPDHDGLVFEIDSVEELQDKILTCIENPELRAVLSDNFSQKAKAIYAVNLMVPLTERLYRDVIVD